LPQDAPVRPETMVIGAGRIETAADPAGRDFTS